MNTATQTINTNQKLNLVVSDIGRSLDYYHGKLGFEVLAQSRDCAQLRISSGYVLNLCLQGVSADASGFRARCIRFSQQGMNKLLRYPQILVRPFMAQRSRNGSQLPVQLQDPDGNRLGVCVEAPETSAKPTAKQAGSNGFRSGLVRIFSDLAAFHGYRR
ncbi:hypothetical protein IDSA_05455 [Pseudidiomarina salinarum]|uniref:VOC domain-containing protein n=1 Tax=Pseudidiomarina salinarum TaxID=435908 RepID=A0A094JHU3_9GAMM|nr:hypothetical protein [Pseudidiomarina salinarum]KFZ32116.1 hypothetical protein IDSA_05455 [Pseudidiomarina salinarum]RUO70102.1 hypothetical protein CWI79_01135 [Pseudidiomarina salinarum]